MGTVLDVVPNHMATDDAEPLLARPGAARAVLRRRPRHRPAPALLRRRRARRACASRSPRCSRRCTASCSTWSRRGSSTGCASTTPTGSPTRAATSSGCAAEGVRADLGREDPRARRAAARLAGRGDDGLRLPQRRRRRSSSTRRARRRSPSSPGQGDFHELAADGEARAGRDDVPARGRAAAAAARRAGARARARVAARLPHLRRAVERPRRGRRPRGARRGCPRTLRRVLLLEERGPRRVRHALPADDAGR